MAQPCVVDGRTLLDPATMLKAGFCYEDLGRWTSAAGGGVAPILGGAKGKGKRRAAQGRSGIRPMNRVLNALPLTDRASPGTLAQIHARFLSAASRRPAP